MLEELKLLIEEVKKMKEELANLRAELKTRGYIGNGINIYPN